MQRNYYYLIEITTRNYMSVDKLLVLDKSTWICTAACRLLVLGILDIL